MRIATQMCSYGTITCSKQMYNTVRMIGKVEFLLLKDSTHEDFSW